MMELVDMLGLDSSFLIKGSSPFFGTFSFKNF